MTPESWELTTVGQLGAPGKSAIKAGPFGSALKKEFYVPSGFKVYGQEQVIAKDPFFGDYYINASKYLELSSCAVEPGDILLSLVGTVGKVLLLPEGSEPGIINPRLLRLSLDKRRVHGPFMAHYLESDLVVNRLESWAQGGTMGVLNARLVRYLPVLLPPLPEQRQIARVLDTWDSAIRAVEKVAAAKRERKRGLMQVLLTGKKRFMEFHDLPRPRVSLGSQIDRIVGGGTPSRSEPRYWDSTGIPWITVKDLKREVIWDTEEHISERGLRKSSATLVPAGTVIVATRMAVGKSVRCQVPAAINQDLKALFPKTTLRSDYLHLVLQASQQSLEAIASGSTVKGIRLADLRGLTFDLPPVEEQAKISAALSVAKKEIGTLERQLEAYRLQKRGLMQQLLTGKKRINVDVPEAVPA